ncbi:MAG: hypothetical protein HDT23_08710 [Ruminococcus sp.]|nr:hypothetical protein [Ruminococcus sp.]
MMTPFESAEAYKIVRKIAGTSKGRVIYKLEKYLNDLSEKVYRSSKKSVIKINDAYTIWVYVCIFDDIGNNNDYSSYCVYDNKRYAEEYTEAKEKIREEFNKTKLLSKKHIYNMPDILCDLGNLMFGVKGDNADSELIKHMKKHGLEKECKKDLGRLIRSLGKYTNSLRETYPKEFSGKLD